MTTPTDYPTSPNPGADGAVLLDRVRAALARYVVLPSEAAATGITLWVAATHAQPAWAHAPRLVIRGPEKRCGKSRLLDVVEALAWAPLITVNSSPAAVYRSITADPPTLLVDEADTIFGPKADANEDLRGLLNAGHQRNRPAIRYDAAANRVEKIPTFAMAALAGIGAMPDTIEDRAVIVRMRRRADGETVSPYRHRRDRPALRTLADELHGWLRGDLAELERAEPVMPVEDRAADTWEPLIVVADHAGGPWPDHARAAVLALQSEAADNTDTSDRVRLLVDVHAAFGDEDAIPTATLLQRLKADQEAPWGEYGHNGLTSMKLGVLLREFDVRSDTIRFPGTGQAKGYHRRDFHDAWRRYSPQVLDDPATAERESRTSRTSLNTAGQSGTASPAGTAQAVPPAGTGTAQAVPPQQAVPGLTWENEAGTAGTASPHLRIVGGDR
ncbi:DUF3631 domain-containing protein [Pseudonocardia sp. N23]|uniref:DUF3631 domain-containing protein n=1 Tax=Pseudonocardia sp. N23 TaxID=1987376 RepID=UPI000C023EA5|nr:DUF3631 domain-containing protein [Pseudonocardia sp. N23]GAY11774.1 DNA primase [Pseudonocardia sp. N23]